MRSQAVQQIERGIGLLIVVVLAVGVVVRLLQFRLSAPLWVDESMLALAVVTRPLSELFTESLAFGQLSPPGFSTSLWLSTRFLGYAEWSLRLVPMLGSLLTLLLLWRVARRLLTRSAVAVVLVGAATSPALLRAANEAKPYAIDAMFTLAIVLLTLRLMEDPSVRRRWFAWACVVLLGALLSFPSVVVTAGAFLALLPAVVRSRRVMALAGVTLASSALTLILAFGLRPPATAQFMDRYWSNAFPSPDAPSQAFTMLVGALGSTMSLAGVETPTVLFTAAACAGMILWAITAPRTVLLMAAPAVIAVLMAVLRLYPVSVRTWLFLAPSFLLGFGMTAEVATRWLRPGPTRTAAPLVFALFFVGPWSSILTGGFAIPRQDPTSPLEQLDRARKASEPVYVFARATPAWLWYRTDWSDPGERAAATEAVRARRPGQPWFHNQSRRDGVPVESWGSRGAGIALPGAPSGLIQNHGHSGDVDSLWASSEVRRIEALSTPCVWLYATNVPTAEWTALASALASDGWTSEEAALSRGEGRTTKYCRQEA